MSHYHHLTINERENILRYRAAGEGIRPIARKMNRSPSTISRELSRNRKQNQYSPSEAQAAYTDRRLRGGRKRKLLSEGLRAFVRQKIMEDHWSPEQIQERVRLEGHSEYEISYPTIYRAIHAGLLTEEEDGPLGARGWAIHLRHKGKPRVKRGTEKRGKFPIPRLVSERPVDATLRLKLGHWEGDTVLGKQSRACLLTWVDRKSRYLLAAKLSRKTKAEVSAATIELMRSQGPHRCQTLTPDRGKEFAGHVDISSELGVLFYFPLPHHAWERGTNENTNGLLREFSPKGQDMTMMLEEDLDTFVKKLNHRPRKCLGWRCPQEVHYGEVLHLV